MSKNEHQECERCGLMVTEGQKVEANTYDEDIDLWFITYVCPQCGHDTFLVDKSVADGGIEK